LGQAFIKYGAASFLILVSQESLLFDRRPQLLGNYAGCPNNSLSLGDFILRVAAATLS
jgi:hypothetical protein